MFSTRSPRCVVLITLACCAGIRAAAAAEPTDADIKHAIEAARAHLRLVVSGLQTGRQSLATMALLKTGVSPDDPQLKPIIAKIAGRVEDGKFQVGSDHVYDAGVTL
ncbi:MAG TPA: hypothetical protein VHB77_01470, partial [Planctomycetaceae bacterium]|nr:hypothetical protein [Planctomycetaceae bacterium]